MENIKMLFKKVCQYGISFLYLFALSTVLVNAEETADGTAGIFEPLTRLKTIVIGLMNGVGILFVLYGAFNCAMSFSSHDPSQRSSGILSVVTGLIIVVAPLITDFLIG